MRSRATVTSTRNVRTISTLAQSMLRCEKYAETSAFAGDCYGVGRRRPDRTAGAGQWCQVSLGSGVSTGHDGDTARVVPGAGHAGSEHPRLPPALDARDGG